MIKGNNIFLKKIKGIYINYRGKCNKSYINSTLKLVRSFNYATLGLLNQSVHHTSYNFDDNGILEKVNISFRPSGIKPEDIDGFLLEKKHENVGLNNYEHLIYSIWKSHYNNGMTIENKQIDSIVNDLHRMKCKWTNTPFIELNLVDDDYIDELKEEALTMMSHITRYENV